MASEPNLRVLRPSRKPPRPGDIFVMRPPDGLYLFGRVIATDAAAYSFAPLVLLYIFKVRTSAAELPRPECLMPSELLLPPIMTNRLGWTRGYFETIAHRELGEGEVLPVHCFRHRLRADYSRYYDEYNHELPGPIPPVGFHGVGSYRTIDDEVSDALGIPQAPD